MVSLGSISIHPSPYCKRDELVVMDGAHLAFVHPLQHITLAHPDALERLPYVMDLLLAEAVRKLDRLARFSETDGQETPRSTVQLSPLRSEKKKNG